MRHPPQINCPPETVKCLDSKITIRILALQEWYLTDGSSVPERTPSKPPTYTAQVKPEPNSRIQSSFIGSFCPGLGSPHLHGTSLFHRASLRDSAQIVTPFVQVETYSTMNFAQIIFNFSKKAGLYLKFFINFYLHLYIYTKQN